MEFYDITDDDPAAPGEMLLYSPRHSIVVCAGIVDEKMRAFDRGAFLEDEVEQFKKIKITPKEYKKRTRSKCKGCGSKRNARNAPDVTVTETTNAVAGSGCKGCGTVK